MRSGFGLHAFSTMALSLLLATPSFCAQRAQHKHHSNLDTLLIGQTIGVAGTWNAEEGVYKVSFPRTDVKITVDGVAIPPYMGLTTWAGFQQSGDSSMIMGDMVLFQDEVNPVMSVLLDSGLSVTALHNHFFYSDPPVFFMHLGGEGKAGVQALALRAALDKIKSLRSEHPTPAASFGDTTDITSSNLTPSLIDPILNVKGGSQGGMLKYVIGRSVKMPCGCTVGKEMGVNTWAAFMGTPEHTILDGDIATAQGELQPVLKTLRHADINVAAIHSHMEGESPHLIFLHFWGTGAATHLAQGFKEALDAQNAARNGVAAHREHTRHQ